ncbi:MAG: Gfo/Idh/MocA family oxidoreductase [Betaproteobacteria bacterium]|nr:Gfo/Idh/MocA family oxidoreductase [Betaproteobacteria bacterium]
MTANEPIEILLVGCGAFAHRYHVPAIVADDSVSVGAIFDPQASDATRALAQRYAAPLVTRLEELPAPRGLAFALVTTPHTLHAGHVEAMLERKLHTLVDKPFVLKAADARRLAARADAQGVVNAVAYNRRFDRGCLRAREILRAGGIGEVRFVQTVQLGYERAGWFLVPELGGGGPYTGRASHMADLLPWLIGRTPTRLRSRLRTSSPARSDHGGFIELQFESSPRASLRAAPPEGGRAPWDGPAAESSPRASLRAAPPEGGRAPWDGPAALTLECQMTCIEEGLHMWDEVRIFGDDGAIELRRPLTAPIGWAMTLLSGRGQRIEELAADSHPGDATRNFVAAVRGQARVACTFAEATPSVAIIELAFESARRDGAWLPIPQETIDPRQEKHA